MRSCALYTSAFTKNLNLKKILPGFYSRNSVFFTLFLPLTTGFPSKNRMLLTHHQHDFENFRKHFSWLYSNVNTPYKRQVWPRLRCAKVALLTYIFTFCNFLWEPNNMAKFSHNWTGPKHLQHKIQTSNFCSVTVYKVRAWVVCTFHKFVSKRSEVLVKKNELSLSLHITVFSGVWDVTRQ